MQSFWRHFDRIRLDLHKIKRGFGKINDLGEKRIVKKIIFLDDHILLKVRIPDLKPDLQGGLEFYKIIKPFYEDLDDYNQKSNILYEFCRKAGISTETLEEKEIGIPKFDKKYRKPCLDALKTLKEQCPLVIKSVEEILNKEPQSLFYKLIFKLRKRQ